MKQDKCFQEATSSAEVTNLTPQQSYVNPVLPARSIKINNSARPSPGESLRKSHPDS